MTAPLTGAAVDTLGKKASRGVALRSARRPPSVQRPALGSYTTPWDANQQQARKGDRHLYAARTRFIPTEIVGHFERRSWAAARPSMSGQQLALAPIDLRERLRGTWRRTGT